MKNSNTDDDKKIYIIFLVLAIVIFIAFVLFTIVSSTTSLTNIRSNISDISNNETNIPKDIPKKEDDEKEDDNQTIEDQMNIPKEKVPSNTPITSNPTTTPMAPKEEQISTFSTVIYDNEANRMHNIKLAVSKLNNALIDIGQEFSFNRQIGAMDGSNGFEKATGFNGNGKKVKIYGGGICQISSTLYNTAMQAGLGITERHPHSTRVYYVPKNKDATVMSGGADLKFKNNSQNKLKITASEDGHNVTVNILKIT